MKFTYEFDLDANQVEELEMLRKAMEKYSDGKFEYDLQKTFNFVMELGSIHRINKAIENAAYYYDDCYENYPYKYGNSRTREMLEIEKETGKYQDTSYPNPTIVRD